MSHQTLKSANLVRVDVGKAEHLYAARQNLGESAFCSAGSQYIQHDIYGRPASQNTLPMKLDASCAQGSQYNAERIIQIENIERPYLPVCTSGLRGESDFLAVGRDLLPQNLYGEGERGNMVRHYNTKNNAPWDLPEKNDYPYYYHRKEQPFYGSMDATKSAYYH
jgi:hypothetical protein